jgi:hypothetical protein
VFLQQSNKLRLTRSTVWLQLSALLCTECKKALSAVKSAVVSKYRMTNKPAPETPSAYVETILQPVLYVLHSSYCVVFVRSYY